MRNKACFRESVLSADFVAFDLKWTEPAVKDVVLIVIMAVGK